MNASLQDQLGQMQRHEHQISGDLGQAREEMRRVQDAMTIDN